MMQHDALMSVLNYSPGVSYGIGSMGEHLTIVILSLDRVKLTLKLLSSFATHMPCFKGRFLIIDNGSTDDTLNELTSYISKHNQLIRLISAKTNLGVAGGRNYASQYVTTDWIMFLDNDIYLDRNFLPILHQEVNALGAHFVSLPLKNPNGSFFARGGKIYITNIGHQFLHIGGSNANATLENPSIGSFLYGGASVLNVHTFRKVGLFNQDLFIGFEDTEFSIRLWKQGYKVGNSTVSCFIHDHPIATAPEEIHYEKKRFSTQHIIRSAEYATQRHHFGFLSKHDIQWLQSKLKPYQTNKDTTIEKVTENQVPATISPAHESLMNVAIIIDVIDWAFANIAFNLVNLKQNKMHFIVIPYHDSQSFNGNILHILLAAKDCRILHFMWRSHLFNLEYDLQEYCSTFNFNLPELKATYLKDKIFSTCVYDHEMPPSQNMNIRKNFQHLVKKNYYVSSTKLYELYSSLGDMDKPQAICPDGVDLRIFKPQNLSRFHEKNIYQRTIRIGWAGNSRFGKEDHKGLFTIIKPAIARLKAADYDIDFEIADRNIKWRSQHDMPDFYNTMDIVLCASINEGTPNIVLEAMACGVAVVTSDVGIVRDVFGPHQQSFITERSAEAFYLKIKYLLDNRQFLYTLSLENLKTIQAWDWPIMAQNLVSYFKSIS